MDSIDALMRWCHSLQRGTKVKRPVHWWVAEGSIISNPQRELGFTNIPFSGNPLEAAHGHQPSCDEMAIPQSFGGMRSRLNQHDMYLPFARAIQFDQHY